MNPRGRQNAPEGSTASRPRPRLNPLQPTGNSPGARYAAALLVLVTVLAYWPLLSSDFTNWDDQETIVHNRWLNPPKLSHFAEFWNPRRPFMDVWIPMTYTAWSAVAAVAYVPTADPETQASLNPWLFHGANLAVHICSVLLVFAILRRLVGKNWPAAAGAALFALHPVQVEPVAWLSGMKDLLCGCFSLLAIDQYILFAQQNARARDNDSKRSTGAIYYILAGLAALAAMLSKPAGVALPIVVIVIDIFFLRRSAAATARALWPWLAMAALFVLEGRFAQPPHAHRYVTPLALRPLIATDALAFYLFKLVAPIHLTVAYNRSPSAALAAHWPYYTWVAPLGVAWIACAWRRTFNWVAGAVGVCWSALLPVLGLVPFDFQDYSTVADHYLYLAMLGPALAAGFLLARSSSRPAAVVCVIVLAVLGARSFVQTHVWYDAVSLNRHQIAINPRECAGYNNLAGAYLDRHQVSDAIATFRQGLKVAPQCVPLRVNLAPLLANEGKLEEAEQLFRSAQPYASAEEIARIRDGLAKVAQMREEMREAAERSATRPGKSL
ncbi:MAG: Tetratricopeptide 2 repeat protein [Phycisphaerales bacterium]|nr:Tetratricopeptide 2 repeat protein [Phycisphaerales bacterium]